MNSPTPSLAKPIFRISFLEVFVIVVAVSIVVIANSRPTVEYFVEWDSNATEMETRVEHYGVPVPCVTNYPDNPDRRYVNWSYLFVDAAFGLMVCLICILILRLYLYELSIRE